MADRIKNYAQEASQINTLKAIRADFGVTPSSYTPDSSVVTKDRVVTFAQAEEEIVVLEDIEKGVKQQVTEVDIAQKDIANIKALLSGQLYDYQTDSDAKYVKTVPAGAMPYAGLEKVGGKTIVMNQYVQDPTIVYTSNNNIAFYAGTTFFAGHYYYIGYEYNGEGSYSSINIVTKQGETPVQFMRAIGTSTIVQSPITITSNGTASQVEGNVWIYQFNGAADSVTNIQVVDLTLMFGSGNEPTTVAEYQAMFPAEFYAYSAPKLLSAGVNDVVSKDSNNATLQTYSIPAEVQALEGYGWSAGSVSNYIDFERKVFVQRLKRVDLSAITWTHEANGVFRVYNQNEFKYKGEIINAKYTNWTGDGTLQTAPDLSVGIVNGQVNPIMRIKNTAYTTSADLDASFTDDNKYAYIELYTPIETDISAYLTDDNLIQVEAGGTLTFPNQHGDDYRLPVPSEEEYMIDLQEAINNG